MAKQRRNFERYRSQIRVRSQGWEAGYRSWALGPGGYARTQPLKQYGPGEVIPVPEVIRRLKLARGM
jgi:hypothetical protein